LLVLLGATATLAQTCGQSGCAGVKMQMGIDFLNTDGQSSQPANSAADCCQLCSQNPTCSAFTYRTDQKVCWMKADDSNPTQDSSAISGNCDTTPKVPCLGEFTPCPNGACTMGSSCLDCKPGEYLCPSDQTTCVALADYLTCPGLKGSHLDPSLSTDDRIAYILNHTTIAEQIGQLTNKAPAIDHLGIPSYNWLNDDQHGVGRTSQNATVFPNGAGLGATWSKQTIYAAGVVLGKEARGLHNFFLHQQNNRGADCNGCGMTIYGPNLNVVRDPRWGRGQETYGEDPHLMARLTVAWVTGAQNNTAFDSLGPDGKTLRSGLCCKHFAAYDSENIPAQRTVFNANLTSLDMWETYMPAFEACIKEAKATHVMCSYNSINGIPTCGSKGLLNHILRDQWKFDGFVVSDYDAWANLLNTHHYAKDMEDAAAIGINAGMDQEGGGNSAISKLSDAMSDGTVTKETVQTALARQLRIRLRLGMFDPPLSVSYNMLNESEAQSPEHLAIAKTAALESMTLLKNEKAALPLNADDFKSKEKSILVVGPQAKMAGLLMGNYAESASNGNWGTSIFDAITARVGSNTAINYVQGCAEIACATTLGFAAAVEAAKTADVVIVTLGLQFGYEGQVDDGTTESEGHDRSAIELPGHQTGLVAALRAATGKPVIGILIHGGTLALGQAGEQLDAVLSAWYPGIEGGNAVAATIFGDYNPAGRTASTWYTGTDVLPPPGEMDETKGNGTTYRYIKSQKFVSYPFGFGLSYSSFSYSNFAATKYSVMACEEIQLSVQVKNTGTVDGDEVVQVYAKLPNATVPTTMVRLVSFERVFVKAGETVTVSLTVTPDGYAVVYDNADIYTDSRQMEMGNLMLFVGGGQPDYYEGFLAKTVVISSAAPYSSC